MPPDVLGRGPSITMKWTVAPARSRAVAGAGPTLIEAVTYRLAPHTTADDPTRYVPPDELADARERDPIAKFTAELTARGLWSQTDHDRVLTSADEVMEAAVQRAENAPLTRGAFFDHVYAEPTQRLARQRREFNDLHGIEDGSS